MPPTLNSTQPDTPEFSAGLHRPSGSAPSRPWPHRPIARSPWSPSAERAFGRAVKFVQRTHMAAIQKHPASPSQCARRNPLLDRNCLSPVFAPHRSTAADGTPRCGLPTPTCCCDSKQNLTMLGRGQGCTPDAGINLHAVQHRIPWDCHVGPVLAHLHKSATACCCLLFVLGHSLRCPRPRTRPRCRSVADGAVREGAVRPRHTGAPLSECSRHCSPLFCSGYLNVEPTSVLYTVWYEHALACLVC